MCVSVNCRCVCCVVAKTTCFARLPIRDERTARLGLVESSRSRICCDRFMRACIGENRKSCGRCVSLHMHKHNIYIYIHPYIHKNNITITIFNYTWPKACTAQRAWGRCIERRGMCVCERPSPR